MTGNLRLDWLDPTSVHLHRERLQAQAGKTTQGVGRLSPLLRLALIRRVTSSPRLLDVAFALAALLACILLAAFVVAPGLILGTTLTATKPVACVMLGSLLSCALPCTCLILYQLMGRRLTSIRSLAELEVVARSSPSASAYLTMLMDESEAFRRVDGPIVRRLAEQDFGSESKAREVIAARLDADMLSHLTEFARP